LLEDARIASLVKNGETDAYTGIIERYQVALFRYLYRLCGDYDTALDLRQETFVRAYEALLKTGEEIRSFKAWLYRIATNLARQQFRRKRILTFVPFLEQEHGDPSDSLPDPAEAMGERTLVREALAKVKPEQRVCLVLHYVEEFTYRDIAELLGSTEEAVRKRVARGRQEFRRRYEEGSDEEQ
jgi:RNA polymerase sigma-70 factor (ECF subfamily)